MTKKELLERLKSSPDKDSVWIAMRLPCQDKSFKLGLWLESETAKNLLLLNWHLATAKKKSLEDRSLLSKDVPGIIFDYDRGQFQGKTGRKLRFEEVAPVWPIATRIVINEYHIRTCEDAIATPSVNNIDCQAALNIAQSLPNIPSGIKTCLSAFCFQAFNEVCPNRGDVVESKNGRKLLYQLKLPYGSLLWEWAKNVGIKLPENVTKYVALGYARAIWKHCIFKTKTLSPTMHDIIFQLAKATKSHFIPIELFKMAITLKEYLPANEQEEIEKLLDQYDDFFLYINVDIKQPELGKFLVLCVACISPRKLDENSYWTPCCLVAKEAASFDEIVNILENFTKDFPALYNKAVRDEEEIMDTFWV